MIEDCTFEYNQSAGGGGQGHCLQKVDPLSAAVIQNNLAGRRGGGVSTPGGLFENCVLAATNPARGRCIYMGAALRNCTIVANRSEPPARTNGAMFTTPYHYNTAVPAVINITAAPHLLLYNPYPAARQHTNEPE
jgi:hypothetical protein